MQREEEFAGYIAPLIEEHRELAELLATVDVGDATDQQRFRLAVIELDEHISKEEDGLFPAALIALSGRDWDETLAASARRAPRCGDVERLTGMRPPEQASLQPSSR